MDIAVIVVVVVVVVAIEPYSSVYWHGNWLRSSCGHQLSVLQLSHEPAYFMKPTNYYINLAYLRVGRFACYVIQRNDLQQHDFNLIPTVGMPGASKMFFARLQFQSKVR